MTYLGCERHEIYVHNGATLYHYHQTKNQIKTPVLIIYAFVNTPKILDLYPDRSFIAQLLNQHLDVYLLEWGKPNLNECTRTLSDYIFDDIDHAVKTVCKKALSEKIHLMGVCQGGYLSLCYSALKPEHIQSFIPIVTPVNFDVPHNRVFQLSRYFDLEILVNKFGNIPGWCIGWFLQQIEPMRSPYKHWRAKLSVDIPDELSLALTQWEFDCPPQAGAAFLEFGQQCVQQNALVKGNLRLKGQPILLSHLSVPILNIYAQRDHFWPVETVRAIKDYYRGGKYQEYAFEGGHVGIFISKRALIDIPHVIQQWVKENEIKAIKQN